VVPPVGGGGGGGGGLLLENPLTASSVIDAQLFCVFPLTVILTYLSLTEI
jgi:hypothetical protein